MATSVTIAEALRAALRRGPLDEDAVVSALTPVVEQREVALRARAEQAEARLMELEKWAKSDTQFLGDKDAPRANAWHDAKHHVLALLSAAPPGEE